MPSHTQKERLKRSTRRLKKVGNLRAKVTLGSRTEFPKAVKAAREKLTGRKRT